MSPGLHLQLETSACLLDLANVYMWLPMVDSAVPVADKIGQPQVTTESFFLIKFLLGHRLKYLYKGLLIAQIIVHR